MESLVCANVASAVPQVTVTGTFTETPAMIAGWPTVTVMSAVAVAGVPAATAATAATGMSRLSMWTLLSAPIAWCRRDVERYGRPLDHASGDRPISDRCSSLFPQLYRRRARRLIRPDAQGAGLDLGPDG